MIRQTIEIKQLHEKLKSALDYSADYRKPFMDLGIAARHAFDGENTVTGRVPAFSQNIWKKLAERVIAHVANLVPIAILESKTGLYADYIKQIKEDIDYIYKHSSFRIVWLKAAEDLLNFGNSYFLIAPDNENKDFLKIFNIYFPDAYIDPLSTLQDTSSAKFFIHKEYAYKDDVSNKYGIEKNKLKSPSQMEGYDVIVRKISSNPIPLIFSLDATIATRRPVIIPSRVESTKKMPLTENITEIYHAYIVDEKSPSKLRYVCFNDNYIFENEEFPFKIFPYTLSSNIGTSGKALALSQYEHVVDAQAAINHLASKYYNNISLAAEPVMIIAENEVYDAQGEQTRSFTISGSDILTYKANPPTWLNTPPIGESAIGMAKQAIFDAESNLGINDLIQGIGSQGNRTATEIDALIQQASPRLNLYMKTLVEAVQDLTRKIAIIRLTQLLNTTGNSEQIDDVILDLNFDIVLKDMSTSKVQQERKDFMTALSTLSQIISQDQTGELSKLFSGKKLLEAASELAGNSGTYDALMKIAEKIQQEEITEQNQQPNIQQRNPQEMPNSQQNMPEEVQNNLQAEQPVTY